MKRSGNGFEHRANRRTFLKKGMVAAGAATVGAGLLNGAALAFDRDDDDSPITKGDIAILRFLNAIEQVEVDLWTQYSELGGVQDNEISGVNGGNPLYMLLSRFLMAICPNISTTTPMTRLATLAS
jgi:hypothetical protein